jgi:hypothetical protein
MEAQINPLFEPTNRALPELADMLFEANSSEMPMR